MWFGVRRVWPGWSGQWRTRARIASSVTPGNEGFTLVLATVVGLAAGYYLDRWLGTAPWLLLVGLGFGIAAGFVNLLRK